jgi:hypothetical protein
MSASSRSPRHSVCLALGMLGSALVLVAFLVLPFYSFTLGGQVVGPRTGGELASLAMGSVVILIGYALMWMGWNAHR